MTKILAAAIILMCGSVYALTESEQAVLDKIDTVALKQRALDTKTYSGTIEAVLAARAADVNDVAADVNDVVTSARCLIVDANGVPEPSKQFLLDKISATVKKKSTDNRKRNVQLLKAFNTIASDPNMADPNDPNYIRNTETITEMWETLQVICDPR